MKTPLKLLIGLSMVWLVIVLAPRAKAQVLYSDPLDFTNGSYAGDGGWETQAGTANIIGTGDWFGENSSFLASGSGAADPTQIFPVYNGPNSKNSGTTVSPLRRRDIERLPDIGQPDYFSRKWGDGICGSNDLYLLWNGRHPGYRKYKRCLRVQS